MGPIPVRTNAAIYYQKYTDVQVQGVILSNQNFIQTTVNAGTGNLRGAELEAQARLTRDLQVGLNFDYLQFEYTHFNDSVPVATIPDIKLSSKAGRPRYKYGVTARYRFPLKAELGDVSLMANWNWQDENGDPNLIIGGFVPAFGLLNLAMNWNDIGGRPLDASLFASNLLDKNYVVGGGGFYNLLGFTTSRYGEPRMYGVRLRYHFGGE